MVVAAAGGDGGAAEEMDRDGAGGGPGRQQDGQQEIGSGSGEDNGGTAEEMGGGDGGAAEEMDRGVAGDGGRDEPPEPDGWWKWTRTQKRNWKRRGGRARSNSWLRGCQLDHKTSGLVFYCFLQTTGFLVFFL